MCAPWWEQLSLPGCIRNGDRLLGNRAAFTDTQRFECPCYTVNFCSARQRAYLHLVKGTVVARAVNDPDGSDILREDFALPFIFLSNTQIPPMDGWAPLA